MSYKKHREIIENVNQYMEKHNKEIKDTKWREHYHFMMPTGWINDPCGLVEVNGIYHMYCQHAPFSAYKGQMFWGHAISKDMIHWEMKGEGLAPSEPYDDWDDGGIYTGSAIYEKGKIRFFYTACNEEGQVQCLAESEDGYDLIKSEHNPIISIPEIGINPHDFRDPKVWCHDGEYYMVVGGTDGKSILEEESTYKENGYGKVLLYKSSNLIDWKFVNYVVESKGELGTMMECPNFFPIGDKFALIYGPMGMPQRKCVYLTGNFNYKIGRLMWNVMGEVDWGFDYYAPQIFVDHTGRTLMFGWIGSWPFMPWNNLKYDSAEDKWCGSMSLPRVVSLCSDGKLKFEPAKEVESLRKDSGRIYSKISLPDSIPFSYEAGEDNRHCEVIADIDVDDSVKRLEFELRKTENNSTKLILDLENGEMIFDRSKSGNIEASKRNCNFESAGNKNIKIRIFLDSSSVEIYADEYRTVMTNTIYSEEGNVDLSIVSIGGPSIINKLQTFGLEKVISW